MSGHGVTLRFYFSVCMCCYLVGLNHSNKINEEDRHTRTHACTHIPMGPVKTSGKIEQSLAGNLKISVAHRLIAHPCIQTRGSRVEREEKRVIE